MICSRSYLTFALMWVHLIEQMKLCLVEPIWLDQNDFSRPKPNSQLFLYLAGPLSDFNLFVPNHTTGVSNLLSGILWICHLGTFGFQTQVSSLVFSVSFYILMLRYVLWSLIGVQGNIEIQWQFKQVKLRLKRGTHSNYLNWNIFVN